MGNVLQCTTWDHCFGRARAPGLALRTPPVGSPSSRRSVVIVLSDTSQLLLVQCPEKPGPPQGLLEAAFRHFTWLLGYGTLGSVTRSYSIGQLARAADVLTSTLRYYERTGLLQPAGRAGGNYRAYGLEELERLRFIRAAQASGFALKDVATMLSLRDRTSEPCTEVQELIRARLGDVAERAKDLRRVERVLRASLRMCREHEREGRCEVIEKLSGSAPGKRTRQRR